MPQIPESTNIPFVYFGSSRLSVIVLDELAKLGRKPSLVVATPDKPQGRKLEIKPNVVKAWALANNIPVISPLKLDGQFIEQLKNPRNWSLDIDHWPFFVVASYGKIIPTEIINLPAHGSLNIHPSLLPRYRGASPLPTAMLDDAKKTGVSIMKLDAEMDHGPIVAQKEIDVAHHFKDWPIYEDFESFMAIQGARLLVHIMPDWVAGKIMPTEQNHTKATYTKKISKEDAEIRFSIDELKDVAKMPADKAYDAFRKIQALHGWLWAYFFIDRTDANGATKKTRVKITSASFENGRLSIEKVIPEGKKEMTFDDFLSGYLK